jgi:hypothetical protein
VRVPEAVVTPPVRDSGEPVAGEPQILESPSMTLNWRHALPSASSAALAMAVASMVPLLNAFFPLWMLGGGWLAVWLYRRRFRSFSVSSAVGGKIGALAGLLGFLFFAFFTSAYLTIATVGLHQGEQIRAQLRGVLEQAASTNHDARAQALAQWMQTPEGLALVVAFSMFLFLVAFLLLSTAGGIFGATLSRRRLR